MDFQRLVSRYRQFGGSRLLWEYFRIGLLPTIIRAFFRCLIKGQSFKTIYPELLKKVEPYLVERFQISRFRKDNDNFIFNANHKQQKVIWWCWLQGIENAPSVVRACYNSLVHEEWFMENGYQVKLIDEKNWQSFVELPDYVVKKWEKKLIPPALFSDLLRLQLLIKYGGTWIDSTVLCTGFKGSRASGFKKYLDAELFLFQYTPEGTTKDISISNWFITSCSHNEVLLVLRDMLFAYWKDYNCTLDYYIFHLFFKMIADEYPEKVAAMPYGYSMNSLVLLHHWGEDFDQKKWDTLTENVCFHKLAFRVSKEIKHNKRNYYNRIRAEYGCV